MTVGRGRRAHLGAAPGARDARRSTDVGVRAGETMREVLVGPGETVGPERHQGVAPIEGDDETGAAEWASERIPEGATREAARPIWLEAMELPGLSRG